MENHSQHTSSVLISFIITVYNLPADMVKACIDSIKSLSLRSSEREIIMVDDGSKDFSLNQVEDYIDDIIYIRQQNQGLSMARNTGLKIASGQYIQFVDGDDYLQNAAYEHCMDLVRFQHPDMVLFDFDRQPDEQTIFNDIEIESGARYMSENNIKSVAWCYIFRRSIIGSLRFTPGIYHEDDEFTPQLLLHAEKIFVTDAKAYIYRIRKDSITQNVSASHIQKRLNDKHDIIVRLRSLSKKLFAVERQALQRRTAQLTMDYIYQIIVETRSRIELNRRLSELKDRPRLYQ